MIASMLAPSHSAVALALALLTVALSTCGKDGERKNLRLHALRAAPGHNARAAREHGEMPILELR